MDPKENPQFEIVRSSDTTEALTRAEIDVQIATAHKFPRDLAKFTRTAKSLVSQDVETAAACFYTLPRGRSDDGSAKVIAGSSVRLAEIAASAFGNIRVYGRVIAIEEKFVVAQGLAHDLEQNVCYAAEVRRRITTKNGARFSDDMIIVTSNAAIAIATRNATFKAIPLALLKPVITEAERVVRGDVKTLPERRDAAMAWFKDKGIPSEALFAYIGVGGIQSIDLDKLVLLAGIRNRIEDEGHEAIAEILAFGKPAGAGNIFQTEVKVKATAPPAVEAPPAGVKTAETGTTASGEAPTHAATPPGEATQPPKAEPEPEMTLEQAVEVVKGAWLTLDAKTARAVCDGFVDLPKFNKAPKVEAVLALAESDIDKFGELVDRLLKVTAKPAEKLL